MAAKRKKKGLSWLGNIFLLLFFLTGVGILFYPTISDLWNNYRNQQLISTYDQVIRDIPKEDYSAIWQEAREYNEQHRVNSIMDAFDEELNDYVMSHPYDDLLNPMGNEIMGYIEIPKINVKLAIYHGVGTDALENGCGHIEGTSLPIGGVGNHTVLSAHRGLPSAKLFTDLDQLEEGDLFFLNILGEKLAYQVDQIKEVFPEETKDLAIENDKDLCTLITCTPYGVNTHRLLVRGIRTEYTEEDVREVKITLRDPMEAMDRTWRLLILGVGAFFIFLIILSITFKISDRRKAEKKAALQQEKKEDN